MNASDLKHISYISPAISRIRNIGQSIAEHDDHYGLIPLSQQPYECPWYSIGYSSFFDMGFKSSHMQNVYFLSSYPGFLADNIHVKHESLIK